MRNRRNRGFIDWLIEVNGRNRPFELPSFPENEIVSAPYEFNVSLVGMEYLPVPANYSAVIVPTSGERILSQQGGLVYLKPGKYQVYYVDLRERIYPPSIEADTIDNFRVRLTVSITFQAYDPLKIQNMQNPLAPLYASCDAAVKNFIQTNRHDALIGEAQNGERLSDIEITEQIKMQISNHPACRPFKLQSVSVTSRQGDNRALENRQKLQLQERETQVKMENLRQQLGLADAALQVEKIKAFEGGEVKKITARADLNVDLIRAVAIQKKNELEIQRKLPAYQQEIKLRQIDAKMKLLDAIIEGESISGFTKTEEGLKFIEKIVNGTLAETDEQKPKSLEPGVKAPKPEEPQTPEPREDPDSSFIHLLIPKKKPKE